MMNKFIDSAIFVSCFTAILYCAYSRYNIGFLSEFGVYQDLLDRNLNQVLFYGIHILLIPLVKISLKCLIVLSILYLILKLLKFFKKNIVNYLKNNNKKIIDYLILISSFFDDFHFLKRIISFTYCLILIFALFIYGFQYFQDIGSVSAKKMYTDIVNKKYKEGKISIKINDKNIELFLISCGNSNCVGLEDVEKKLYYFPSNSIFSENVKNREIFE